jgi:hypothetical protein
VIRLNHGHLPNCDDSLGFLLNRNVIRDFLNQGHFLDHESIHGHLTLGHHPNCDVVRDHHAFGCFLHYDVHDHFALGPLLIHDVVRDSPIFGPHPDYDVHVCIVLYPLIFNCDVVCDNLALGPLINFDCFVLDHILDHDVVHNRLALGFFLFFVLGFRSMDDLLVRLKEVIHPNEPKLKVDCVILHQFFV